MSTSSGITSPVKAAMTSGNNGAQLAQIIKLPNDLNNNPKTVRLEGQIVAQNPKNNTATVSTKYGEIEIRVKGNRQPQLGQKVELDIPAGRPPQKAEVRVAPQQNPSQQSPSQQSGASQNTNPQNIGAPTQAKTQTTARADTPQQASQQAQTNIQTTQQANPARVQQNIPTAIQEALTTTRIVSTNQKPQIITPDVTVRVLSVPPATANTIAQQFIASLPPPTTNTLSPNILINTLSNTPSNTLTAPTLNAPAISVNSTSLALPPTTISSAFINNAGNNAPASLQSLTPATIQTTASSPLNLQAAQTVLNPVNTPTGQVLNASQVLNPSFGNQVIGQITGQSIVAPPVPAQNIQGQTIAATPINFDPANPTLQTSSRVPQIDLQILKVIPPNATITPPTDNGIAPKTIPALTQFPALTAGANSAVSLTAQVTGFTNNGLPLITIQGVGGQLTQSFVLQNPNTNLQLGSQLQIIPKGGTPVTALPPLAMKGLPNPLLQGFQWQAIDDLYQALQSSGSQNAASLGRSLPNAGTPNQLSAAGLMFIAAIKSGNFDMILGDRKIDLLQRMGRGNILDSMTQNSARAGAAEPAVQSDWRAVPLPMFWENEIHKITLFTRQEGDQSNQDNQKNGSTRFVFDLSLSRMGDVQIDGLIKDNRLDLVLRTENAFSEPMQQTMRQAYSSALTHTELAGELNFQGSTSNWVHVLEQEEQLGVSI